LWKDRNCTEPYRNKEGSLCFVAFAPKDNPKIAIAVYVENAGFGATYAAPIASLMIEKYLKIPLHKTSRGSYSEYGSYN
jgi:penicillin-binding protein 2